MPSKEFEWYVKTDLNRYKGKYVAIVDNEVIASGINTKKVLEEVKRKKPNKKPLIAKVPEEETLILVLWK